MRLIAILINLFVFLSGYCAEAGTYENEQYGFHVDLPNGKTVCSEQPPAPNHGFVLLLDSKDCSHFNQSNRIHVFASYNTSIEAKTAIDLSPETCRGKEGKLTDFNVNGLMFYTCENNSKKSEYIYFLLRPDTNEYHSTEFTVMLFCNNSKCNRHILRKVLAGMHIQR